MFGIQTSRALELRPVAQQQPGDGEERSPGGRVSVQDLEIVVMAVVMAEEVTGLQRIRFQHAELEIQLRNRAGNGGARVQMWMSDPNISPYVFLCFAKGKTEKSKDRAELFGKSSGHLHETPPPLSFFSG